MGEVVELECLTSHRVEPDRVLSEHVGRLERVLVLGFDKDGEFIAATSQPDLAEAAWLATKFIHKCHNGDY